MEWDESDREKAIQWGLEKAKQCPHCGTRPEEWEKDRFAYVGQAYKCPGCELLQQERQNVREGAEASTTVYLVPFDQAKEGDEE